MTKEELLKRYIDYTDKVSVITRDEFLRIGNVTNHQINKWFGSFGALKKHLSIPRISEKTNSVTVEANSIEEVIYKCNVDLNLWEVDKFNTKELNNGGYSWTVYFKRKTFVEGEIDFSSLIDEVSKISPIIKLGEIKKTKDSLLAEVNIPDLHIGKLSWKEEVGHNYDLKIAQKLFRDCIDYFIDNLKKHKVERILFPVGSDFYHVENMEGTTSAGTQQDTDNRYLKMFRYGYSLIIESINKLQAIAPVDCLMVYGNHARVTEMLLGELLSVYYDKNPNVKIDNRPLPRKYYTYNNSLISLVHGDEIRLPQLPAIMAAESPESWGKSKYRYIRTGHYHHQKIILDEISGCQVEIVGSLSGTDYWHKKKAFCNSIRSATTFLYSQKSGCTNKIYFNL